MSHTNDIEEDEQQGLLSAQHQQHYQQEREHLVSTDSPLSQNDLKAPPAVAEKEKSLNWTFLSLCAFFLLGAIWGSAFAFIKLAVDEKEGFPPITVVAFRVLIGGIGMLFLLGINCIFDLKLRAQAKEHFHMGSIMHMAIMAFFNNVVPFILVAYAETSINSGAASILNSTIPLFALIFAHFALKGEKFTILKVAGLLVGFVGVILVCLEKVVDGGSVQIGDFWGYALMTLSSASYAIASVYARKYMQHIPGMIASTGQILSAATMSVVVMVVVDIGLSEDQYSYFARAGWKAWVSVAYLGIISTLVAYILYFYLINTVGSVKQTLVGFLLPVVGVFQGAIMLGEWNGVSWFYIAFELLGTALIFFGVGLVSIPKLLKKTPHPIEEEEGGTINVIDDAYDVSGGDETMYDEHKYQQNNGYPDVKVSTTKSKSFDTPSSLATVENGSMN